MGSVEYFFDTYAFLELLRGNPKYAPYGAGVGFITTKLNLLEFHYRALDLYGERVADGIFDKLLPHTIPIPDRILVRASKFKRQEKRKRLSYVDCIGYMLAQERGVKFLTGDKAFENIPDVEFVT